MKASSLLISAVFAGAVAYTCTGTKSNTEALNNTLGKIGAFSQNEGAPPESLVQKLSNSAALFLENFVYFR